MSLDPILVASPVQYPGICLDGSQGGPNEPVVDTHIEMVGGTRVYLSKRMVRDAARLYGFAPAEETARLEQRAAEAEARVVALETELAEARPVLDAMARAAARFGDIEADDEPVRSQPRPQQQQRRRR